MLATPTLTLALAATLGVLLMALAHRIHIPSIALLLVAGVALGPEGLGFIEPDALGHGLALIVGMAVAIILFEGGLTLDLVGARRNPKVIWRVLTLGVLITWLGSTLVTHYLLGVRWSVALLCGSLVIVTGPTVIAPLLRRIGVRESIKHILYWEAVLVDAIGVFIAVLCFEWLFATQDQSSWSPLMRFAARLALGIGGGALFGAIIALLLRARAVPEEYANVFVLTMALTSYGVCEAILHESGILAVIIAGLIVGLTKPKQLAGIKRFKLQLTELAIGTLFILLSAKLELAAFTVFGWNLVAAVAVLLFVLRPLVIVTATKGAGFSVQEKLFLSWIAPRGIVAAFMASLFSISLARDPSTAAHGEALQAFTFAVIATTVILQGLTAPWLARVLGLQAEGKRTWLLVGNPILTVPLTAQLRRAGGAAIALSAPDSTEESPPADKDIVRANPLDLEMLDDPRFADVGAVAALTANPYLNQLICERWAEVVHANRCIRVAENTGEGQLIESGFVGRPAWRHALSPAELCQRLEAGSVAIDVISATPDALADQAAVPLFKVSQTHEVDVCDGADPADQGGVLVVVRPRIEGLARLIRGAVVLEDEPLPFEGVIVRLLQLALADTPDLPADELLATIVHNEQYMPMALGAGVAIPHAYHATIEHPRCYVANARGGMIAPKAERTVPSERVQLVFLVLSPLGRAEEHLRSLAAIARLTGDKSYRGLLEAEHTDASLMTRILARA
jgi:NhaP-type Na+/H+ or K+/H+ antiporter/mannitol/fructose-specific phosphotransferase system IIA component (Ntr-type)